MKVKQIIEDKYLLYYFMVFWFFSVIGSTLFIGSTMLSFRNLLFPGLFLIIYWLRKQSLNNQQLIFFIPIGLLFIYGSFMLFIDGIPDIEMIKDYFYFSYIPVLFLSIMMLSNQYQEQFFDKVAGFTHYLIYFLFIVTLFEFITDFHFEVHTPNRFHIPSAFFTNANDMSVIMIQLFMLATTLKKKEESDWKYILVFLLTTFIVFITLSRLALVAFIIISISIFLLKTFNWKLLIINILVITAALIYLSIDLPTALSSTTVVDRSKSRINSMTELEFNEVESLNPDIGNTKINIDEEGDTIVSSTHVRLDIYKIPLREPQAFYLGHGFNADKKVIEKYKTLPYKIINSHSYFIQLIFYFGWFGFGLMVLFFASITVFALLNYKEMAFLVPITIVQFLLLNIPSSVMRFPLVWIPFFIAIAYYTNLKKS